MYGKHTILYFFIIFFNTLLPVFALITACYLYLTLEISNSLLWIGSYHPSAIQY